MKPKRTSPFPPQASYSGYTHTYNQHMAARHGAESTHVRLTLDDMKFARLFSDRGTLVGGIRRAIDQARKRCGKCQCCKKVTVGEPDYSARMYPSDGL